MDERVLAKNFLRFGFPVRAYTPLTGAGRSTILTCKGQESEY